MHREGDLNETVAAHDDDRAQKQRGPGEESPGPRRVH